MILKMFSLPSEIILQISDSLDDADKWMLKITCISYYNLINTRNDLLESCIMSSDIYRVKLAESWGNEWKDDSYFYINSVDVFNYKCLIKGFFFLNYDITHDQLRNIYLGACFRGNRDVLRTIIKIDDLRKKYSYKGLRSTILGKNYDFLDEFADHTMLWNVAAETLDIVALKYCISNGVPSNNWLDNLCESSNTMKFLTECHELGINFSGIKLPNTISDFSTRLLLVSFGVDYRNYLNDFFYISNLGKIDWNNPRHKEFVEYNLSNVTDYNMTKRAKLFLIKEGKYESYKDLLSDKRKIIEEFKSK